MWRRPANAERETFGHALLLALLGGASAGLTSFLTWHFLIGATVLPSLQIAGAFVPGVVVALLVGRLLRRGDDFDG